MKNKTRTQKQNTGGALRSALAILLLAQGSLWSSGAQAQVAYAGVDRPVCTNTIILQGNIPNSGSTGTWLLLSGSGNIVAPNQHNSQVTGLGSGTNEFRWTINDNGVETSDNVVITNNSFNVFAGFDETFCRRVDTLAGTPPAIGGSGLWSVVSGSAAFTNQNAFNTVVQSLPQGTTALRWYVEQNGCTDADTVRLTNDLPDTPVGGADVTTCVTSAQLNAQAPVIGTGAWSVTSGYGEIANANAPITTIENLLPGVTQLRWTVTNRACALFDVVEVTSNDFQPFAGVDQTLCANSATLAASSPAPGIGFWTVLFGSTATPADYFSNQTAVSNLRQGANFLVWTENKNNCSKKDTVVITNDLPTAPNAGLDQTICQPTHQLNGNDPVVGNGTWAVTSGSATIFDPTQNNTSVANLGQGPNTFRWRVVNNACPLEDNVVITNFQALPNAGGDQDLCSDTTTLQAQNPSPWTGQWNVLEGSVIVDTPTRFNSKARSLGIAPNLLEWRTLENGCVGLDTVVVTSSLIVANAGPDQVVCAQTTLAANAFAPGVGEWRLVGGNAVLDDMADPQSDISLNTYGVHSLQWRISYKSCTSVDNVDIFNDFVRANAGPDIAVCGDTVLTALQPVVGQGLWTTSSGTTIVSPTRFNSRITSLDYGPNRFRWTVTNNLCVSVDSVVITNNDFVIEAGPRQDLCEDNTILQGENPSPGTGTWTLASGSGSFVNYLQHNTRVNSVVRGRNVYRWTVFRNGCTDFDDVEIYNFSFDAYAGPDVTTCFDTVVMQGLNPAPGAGQWTVLEGTAQVLSPNLFNTEIRQLSYMPVLNRFRWTMTKDGCTFADEVAITYQTPSTASAGQDQILCDFVGTLSADEPEVGSGLWTVLGGSAVVENRSQHNSPISNVSLGNNYLKWEVEHEGCISQDTVMVSNNKFSAFAGPDQLTCNNFTTLQGANPLPGTGLWTILQGTGNIVLPEYFITNVTGIAQGVNRFRWSMQINGCSDFDEVEVANNRPSLAQAGNDQTLCDSSTVLAAQAPAFGTGIWSVVLGSGVVTNPSQHNSPVRSLPFGLSRFKWTVDNAGCFSEDQVDVRNDLVLAFAGQDQAVCSTADTLHATSASPGQGQWYVIAGGASVVNPTFATTRVTNLAPGVNRFRWVVSHNACTRIDTVEVRNDLPSAANAGPDQLTVETSATLGAALPTIGTGSWSAVGSGAATVANPSQSNTGVANLAIGSNTFRWTVVNFACVSSDDMVVNRVPGVWPGDANNDGAVNQYDVLPIGLSFDMTGPNRPNGSSSWQAQYAPNWSGNLPGTTTNRKFADCNGNGTIDELDLSAINLNFQQSHADKGLATPTDGADFLLGCYWTGRDPETGLYRAELVLDRTDELNMIYGFGFDLAIENGQNIDFGSVQVNFDDGWFDPTNVQHFFLRKVAAAEQRVYVGVSRNDFVEKGDTGRIGELFVAFNQGDTTGVRFNVNSLGGTRLDGTPVSIAERAVNGGGTSLPSLARLELRVRPNPTTGMLFYDLPQWQAHTARVFDMAGRLVLQQHIANEGNPLDLSALGSGVYLVEVATREGIFRQKVLKQD